MKNFLKSKRGITLIALVITIVVLIILAAVIINLSLGDNGIFNRVKTAKEQYQNAESYEQIETAKLTNEIDSYINGNRDYTSISYSTEEQDTGLKWINGKTLYQKTYVTTSPSKNDVAQTIAQLPNDIEMGYVYDGYMQASSIGFQPLNQIISTNMFSRVWINITSDTSIAGIRMSTLGFDLELPVIVTIRYTKK